MKPVSGKDFGATAVRGSHTPNASPLVREKRRRRDGSEGSVADLEIARTEVRQTDHRHNIRQPLSDTRAEVRHGGKSYPIVLLNVSGGGALIQGNFPATLWDRIELVLVEFGEIECVIRWTNNDRFGLEFAHETQLLTDLSTRTEVLREAAALYFEGTEPNDVRPPPENASVERSATKDPSAENREKRHPLLWMGHIWNDQGRVEVRLRNISAGGALVQVSGEVCAGARVLLDLKGAGTLRAVVRWSLGDQAGLVFDREFDVRKLANCKPNVAPKDWAKPEYLLDESDTSPWASRWGRLTVAELRRTTGR